jgi:hypothetical protein
LATILRPCVEKPERLSRRAAETGGRRRWRTVREDDVAELQEEREMLEARLREA